MIRLLRSAAILILLGTIVVAFALHDHVSCAPGVTACDPIVDSNPWRPMLVFGGVVLGAVLWLMAGILAREIEPDQEHETRGDRSAPGLVVR
jgi:hypothetical protein